MKNYININKLYYFLINLFAKLFIFLKDINIEIIKQKINNKI